jgi:adenylate cyclase
MKRKIAAILAADIAGYSKLVAEDEEETLRRLGSYRAVFDDFIKRHDGRIFNTAGDAVLAEFPSAVEAVRCAIDVQESLRTRNLAYPPSRQMSFRIGITIGDVVEREGDLLGDGVNIAARLESLANPGGICVSRTVYEQVANKLSVPFSDIGEQMVKNIPTPVHAFLVNMHGEEGTAPPKPGGKAGSARRNAAVLPVVGAACAAVAAIGVLTMWRGKEPAPAAPTPAAPGGAATTAATVPAAATPSPPAMPKAQSQPLVPELIPYASDRSRQLVRNEYMAAPDHKAIVIGVTGIGMATGRESAEAAERLAMETCQRQMADNQCHLYAVGNVVVSPRVRPPLPPQPWYESDAAVEQPFDAKIVPFVSGARREWFAKGYSPGKPSKALAIAPTGDSAFYHSQSSRDEAVRRALERCGVYAGTACRILAVDDKLVVPIPRTARITGYFHPESSPAVSSNARAILAQRYVRSGGGWSAVAVGSAGRPGVALKAQSEADAVAAAITDCSGQDTGCRVIAIGPFSVEP